MNPKKELEERYNAAVKKCEDLFDGLVKDLNVKLDAYKCYAFDAKTKYSIENTINYFIDTVVLDMQRNEISPFIFRNHCNNKYENIQDGELFEIDESNNAIIVHFEVIPYRIIYFSTHK